MGKSEGLKSHLVPLNSQHWPARAPFQTGLYLQRTLLGEESKSNRTRTTEMEEREGLIKIKDWNSQYILESQLPYFVVLCAKQDVGFVRSQKLT